MTTTIYTFYNGFARGFYRESKEIVIDQNCLGDWVNDNLTYINNVLNRTFNGSFDVSYDEAVEAATDVVNLFYENEKYCKLKKVYDDISSICPDPSSSSCMND